MTSIAIWMSWGIGGCVSSELLGYFLHRLMHCGRIGFLSRNHMRHHLELYGPLQKQRTPKYLDATTARIGLGNIGAEWLIPTPLLIAATVSALYFLKVPMGFAFAYLGTALVWSFLMFSYLHDIMHVEKFWLSRNRWLKNWFLSARTLHDIHHQAINDRGLMNKNFGIGFYFFDRLFGTFLSGKVAFNHSGYQAALRRYPPEVGK
jgi:sterol desaturase/sphingolipid hydroxylase (fatty acid hydroxylase superfamily)